MLLLALFTRVHWKLHTQPAEPTKILNFSISGTPLNHMNLKNDKHRDKTRCILY